MSTDSFRRAIARGLWLGGLLLLPLFLVMARPESRALATGSRRAAVPGLAGFLFLLWGVPLASSLVLAGYLLKPRGRPWLRARLAGAVRVAVAAALWLAGMACLLGVLVLLIVWMLGLVPAPALLGAPRGHLVVNTLVLFAPVLVTGALFLFASRKWLYETTPA